jgi:fatty acid desaturase
LQYSGIVADMRQQRKARHSSRTVLFGAAILLGIAIEICLLPWNSGEKVALVFAILYLVVLPIGAVLWSNKVNRKP